MDHGLMGVLGADQIFSFITGPAEHLLEKQVNQIISNNSEEIITQLVEQESEHLLDTEVVIWYHTRPFFRLDQAFHRLPDR